jgi:hypothetical protein
MVTMSSQLQKPKSSCRELEATDSTDSAELRESSSCDNPANDPAAYLQNASLFHPLGNQDHIVAA